MAVNQQVFPQFFNYLDIKEWSRANIVEYLHTINENKLYNNRNTDPLDYEKLFFIESEFGDDAEIQEQLSLVKTNIVNNYKRKKQLLYSCLPLK